MRHNLLLNRSRGTASLQPLVLLAIIVVMTGAQAVLVPGSLTVEQMLIISRQASALGIITLGQAAVILVGGIDLSVGATVMMVNIFCISAMQGSDANGPLGLLVCLFIGLAIGTANAFGVLFLKIAPFVMTLCTTPSARASATFTPRAHRPAARPPLYVPSGPAACSASLFPR